MHTHIASFILGSVSSSSSSSPSPFSAVRNMQKVMKGKDREPQKPKCFNIKLDKMGKSQKLEHFQVPWFHYPHIHQLKQKRRRRKIQPLKESWDYMGFCVWKRETEIWGEVNESGFLVVNERKECFWFETEAYTDGQRQKSERKSREHY